MEDFNVPCPWQAYTVFPKNGSSDTPARSHNSDISSTKLPSCQSNHRKMRSKSILKSLNIVK